ncbi:type II secretion system F family protein [Brevibacterium sp. UMB1308A]|uniref:type II secretion system F family protein n=1 Tax=Brevibacterium sp. UMB1308A TaxID=3050608 RepID=UPI00254CB74E|nr:type II secretion system F family protein [Brevibacterium sp. UMB1308A]MDK8346615.1 type II secretion system F family protein [Brevibacterium sp. UMB1308B]MDK8713596.1 type II secretion system F family protein [Brevibacterium sp. UMB1308A]
MIVVFVVVAFGAGLCAAAAVWLFMGPGAGARVRRIFGGSVGGAFRGGFGGSGAGRGGGALEGGRGRFRDRVRAFVMRVRGRGDAAVAVDGSEDSPMIAVIDRAVQLLKVGIEPARAMTLVADLPDNEVVERVLRKVARAMELGEKPDQALRMYAGELGDEDARILTGMASVWFVSEQAGAPAAEMLESYASTCRDRADAMRERDVALAGPISTVMVLSWLPIMSLGLAVLVGADLVELVTSLPGALSICGGLVLLVAGRIWMRSMLSSAR